MLELYHWEPTLESAKVMICLQEKGVAFTSRYVDVLALEQYAGDFLAINPAGQVPVLVHDGNVLTDSALINEYLEEAFPDTPLAPHDARGWYETLCWGKYVEYNLDTSVSTLGWQQVMPRVMQQRDQAALRAAVEQIPVPERRAAWLAALEYAYPEEQLENSRRKIGLAVQRIRLAAWRQLFHYRHRRLRPDAHPAAADPGAGQCHGDAALHGLAGTHRRTAGGAEGPGHGPRAAAAVRPGTGAQPLGLGLRSHRGHRGETAVRFGLMNT